MARNDSGATAQAEAPSDDFNFDFSDFDFGEEISLDDIEAVGGRGARGPRKSFWRSVVEGFVKSGRATIKLPLEHEAFLKDGEQRKPSSVSSAINNVVKKDKKTKVKPYPVTVALRQQKNADGSLKTGDEEKDVYLINDLAMAEHKRRKQEQAEADKQAKSEAQAEAASEPEATE